MHRYSMMTRGDEQVARPEFSAMGVGECRETQKSMPFVLQGVPPVRVSVVSVRVSDDHSLFQGVRMRVGCALRSGNVALPGRNI
jgi:hypothetical protein